MTEDDKINAWGDGASRLLLQLAHPDKDQREWTRRKRSRWRRRWEHRLAIDDLKLDHAALIMGLITPREFERRQPRAVTGQGVHDSVLLSRWGARWLYEGKY